MQAINKQVIETLKEHKIDVDSGLLVLLGIYYELDVDKVCPEEVVKAINTTKIVDKVYSGNNKATLVWKIPLFMTKVPAFGWVKDWNDMWNRFPSRKDNLDDVTGRMTEWCRKNYQYGKEDIIKAAAAYLSTVTEEQYCKRSLLFISEGGTGKKSTSMLLTWVERTFSEGETQTSHLKGRVIK